MHCDHLHYVIPLERYRDLIGLLARQDDAWDEVFWMRIAAQTAVICPDSPAVLAHRIRDVAGALLERSEWYQTLASPARFTVAAMLIQQHIPVAHFLGEHRRIADLMSEVGLRHGRFHEVIAVLILLMSPEHRPSSMLEIERVKAVYDQMKRFHWWLTGPEDLPACAALAQCPGSAVTIVARVEDAYQQLHGIGIPIGDRLQTAASLLPLIGLPTDAVVSRYRGLASAVALHDGTVDPDYFDPLALLTLLDHDPWVVVERLKAVNRELDLFQPEEAGATNITIASDLTVLDLARFDRHQQSLKQPQAVEAMLRTLHVYHLASAVLISQIEPDLVQYVGNHETLWPYV